MRGTQGLIVNVLTLKSGNVEYALNGLIVNVLNGHINLLSVMLSFSAEIIRKCMSIDISFALHTTRNSVT